MSEADGEQDANILYMCVRACVRAWVCMGVGACCVRACIIKSLMLSYHRVSFDRPGSLSGWDMSDHWRLGTPL